MPTLLVIGGRVSLASLSLIPSSEAGSKSESSAITSMFMRLSSYQSQMIRQQIHHHFGDSAAILLFGSRIDDQKKRGDVDLYVETATHPFLDEIRCKINIQEILNMPVDLIVRQPVDGSLIA